jgi:hypothetical protein
MNETEGWLLIPCPDTTHVATGAGSEDLPLQLVEQFWFVLAPRDISPTIVLRDESEGVIDVIDVDATPRSFASAPAEHRGGTASRFGFIDPNAPGDG